MTTTLDLRATTRSRRMLAPVLTIGGIAAATLALRLRDPHQTHSWGVCPLYASTGIWCPGCGGLRAVNDLTHGQVGAALSSNLVLTLAFPVVAVALLLWAQERWVGRRRSVRWERQQWYVVGFIAALTVFTVVRNLPFGAALAP